MRCSICTGSTNHQINGSSDRSSSNNFSRSGIKSAPPLLCIRTLILSCSLRRSLKLLFEVARVQRPCILVLEDFCEISRNPESERSRQILTELLVGLEGEEGTTGHIITRLSGCWLQKIISSDDYITFMYLFMTKMVAEGSVQVCMPLVLPVFLAKCDLTCKFKIFACKAAMLGWCKSEISTQMWNWDGTLG